MKHNQLISELGSLIESFGIREVVICPGSRNAPLIQLFTANPFFHCRSIVDERSAGYYALGIARQSGEPVAVLTTSGTAVLNLAPAVAEANYQQLPLVLITADRPRERMHQFNNQVINQTGVFKANAKGFTELTGRMETEAALQDCLEQVRQLLASGLSLPCGPVHLNVFLEEPLYEKLPEAKMQVKPDTIHPASSDEDQRQSTVAVKQGKKVLVLAGMGRGDPATGKALEGLAGRAGAAVVAENISNLHDGRFISNPELLLACAGPDELADLVPDVVIMFGGQVVSKRLKLFLQSCDPEIIYPDQAALLKYAITAGEPARQSRRTAMQHSMLKSWLVLQKRAAARAEKLLQKMSFCNLCAIHRVHAAIPEGAVVHLGNSGTIRYSQLLVPRADLRYFSNRGTSGIDGSVSAAAGAASISEKLHVLLVGDLSFVYDSNALWNRNFPANLRIVVFNDGGGGIFRLLEGPDKMEFFDEYSVTRHPVSLETLARAFGLNVCKAENFNELETHLKSLFARIPAMSVMEVDTSERQNSRIFKDFIEHMRTNHD